MHYKCTLFLNFRLALSLLKIVSFTQQQPLQPPLPLPQQEPQLEG